MIIGGKPLGSAASLYQPIQEFSKLRTDNVAEIQKLVAEIGGLTENLDDRIDTILHNYELKFMNAYRGHLHKLKELVAVKDAEIERQRIAIEYYESEGVHSELVKRIKSLEQQLNGLYKAISQKEKAICQHKLTAKVMTMENARLMNDNKLLRWNRYKGKVQSSLEESHQADVDIKLSSLHIRTKSYNKPHSNLATIELESGTRGEHFMTEPGDSIQIGKPADYPLPLASIEARNIKLEKEVRAINHKYTALLKNTVNVRDHRTTLQDFFFNCIQEVKKVIAGRKRVVHADLGDFRSDDKLNLLLRLLGRDEIVQAVYQVVFKNKPRGEPQPPQQPYIKSKSVFNEVGSDKSSAIFDSGVKRRKSTIPRKLSTLKNPPEQ